VKRLLLLLVMAFVVSGALGCKWLDFPPLEPTPPIEEPPPPPPDPPVEPEPEPEPEPPPPPPCAGLTKVLDILRCQRARYGTPMQKVEIVVFLTDSVRQMNAVPVDEAPLGLLKKDVGNHCGGWSCDILCRGNGSDQQQWDVLRDEDVAAEPVFHGPLGNIVVRECVIP
jgi:hypothetical protein